MIMLLPRRASVVCTMFVVVLLALTTTVDQDEAAYVCTTGQSCKKDTEIVTHVGARPPRVAVDGPGNFKCPAGSDPAGQIILDHSSSGSDIFFDFGKTTTNVVIINKNMCGGSKGTFYFSIFFNYFVILFFFIYFLE